MLKELTADSQVKFLLVTFTDLFGFMRSKLVPASAVEHLTRNGAAFAGFATHFDRSPSEGDLVLHPDPATFIVLPWQKEVAWITGDLFAAGAPFEQSPRSRLKHALERAQKRGLEVKTGVEAEFFLLSNGDHRPRDERDRHGKPCYDLFSLMYSYPILRDVCEALDALGWRPYQTDHEDANGQFEINWEYGDALTTADRHAFFKFAVKSISGMHGARASFMPKPFVDLTGSGCHVHCSVWTQGKNAFVQSGSSELSPLGQNFVGGLLENAPGLCALTNPTVNSYRRLNARSTSSGATWVTSNLRWGGDNREVLVRVPDADRCEFRLPDGAGDPYLLQLAVVTAGMDGVTSQIHPGEPKHPYRSARFNVDHLPSTLPGALELLHSDETLMAALGERLVRAYLRLRRAQYEDYTQSVSQWELNNTLDC